MFKYTKHKKLVQALTLAFTIQCLGGSFVPAVSYATSLAIEPETAEGEPSVGWSTNLTPAEAEAAYKSAKASEETIKAALTGIIELKDEDDDLQYVNKVYSLMTDSTGKTSQYDNLNALITAAEAEKKEADASGTTVSENAQAILNMAERLAKISADASSGSSAYTDSMKNNDIKIYQTAVSELKTCNVKADLDKANGKTPTACAMTDSQKAAYQRLINNNAIVEAVKKATQQVNQTTNTTTTTNATDATSTSSSSTSTTKQLSCYDGTVLSGNGKCCPTATPIYNAETGVCVTSTTTTSSKKSSSSDDNKNAMLLALLGAGSLETKDGNNGEAVGERKGADNKVVGQNQYSFNYSIQQDEKGSPITYLPINSDDIEFIVYKSSKMNDIYKSVIAQAQQSNHNAKTIVKEKLSIKVPAVFGMNDNEPSVIHYIEVPLEFGKWRELFKDDLKAGIQWNYQNYTNLLRVSAETVNKKVFLATVVYQVGDNFGHSRIYQFYVPFDFTGTTTRIGAELDTKKADIEIQPVSVDDEQELSMSGTVTESVFQDGRCTVKISGTVSDEKTQETLENQTLPYTTGSLNEASCNKLKGQSISVKGAKITDSALSEGTISSEQLGTVESTGSNVVSKNQVITLPNGKQVTVDVLVDQATGETYTNMTEEQLEHYRKATEEYVKIDTCSPYSVSVCKVNPDGSKEDISSNAANVPQSGSTLYISTGNTTANTGNKTNINKISEQNASVTKSVKEAATKTATGFDGVPAIPGTLWTDGKEATIFTGSSIVKTKLTYDL